MATTQVGINLNTQSVSIVGTAERDNQTGELYAISGTVNGEAITGLSDFAGSSNRLLPATFVFGVTRYSPDTQGVSFSTATRSYNIRNTGGDPASLVISSSDGTVSNEPAGAYFGVYSTPICFVRGTRIATTRGAVPIESLRVGEQVATASGAFRPIRWIGHRLVAVAANPEPQDVWPVRITAGALAMGVPVRDLLVSPDHCLVFDDVLIPAKHLINGATIRQEPVEAVDYWHVELDSHDALLAEGTPAESYRDCGMHAFFEGGESWGVRAVGSEPAPLLAPHVMSGPRLHWIKAWLIARAKHLGASRQEDPELTLVADGRVLMPTTQEGRRFAYDVPADTKDLVLRSLSTVAAHWIAENEDRRTLGIRVSSLLLDGAPVSMADDRLSNGWNAVEPTGQERWTTGAAHLPACRALSFEADWFLGYPVEMPVKLGRRVVNG